MCLLGYALNVMHFWLSEVIDEITLESQKLKNGGDIFAILVSKMDDNSFATLLQLMTPQFFTCALFQKTGLFESISHNTLNIETYKFADEFAEKVMTELKTHFKRDQH